MPAGTSPKSFSINPFIRNDQTLRIFGRALSNPSRPKVNFSSIPR